MTVDPDKLREFAATLTDDQTRLLREALFGKPNKYDAIDCPVVATF